MTECEEKIAELRAKRFGGGVLPEETRQDLDRRIAVLTKAWRGAGNKLKIVRNEPIGATPRNPS